MSFMLPLSSPNLLSGPRGTVTIRPVRGSEYKRVVPDVVRRVMPRDLDRVLEHTLARGRDGAAQLPVPASEESVLRLRSRGWKVTVAAIE